MKNSKIVLLSFFLIISTSLVFGQRPVPKYLNTNLPVDERVKDLISRMTLKEKISQMSHLAPAIKRLGIIAYEPNFYNPFAENMMERYQKEIEKLKKTRPWENYQYWKKGECLDGGWWNEALHGVARAGLATSFPQSIGLGSTWDPELIQKMADAISTEARIHNKIYGKKLTYWSPTINILRDPRWGRIEESYSEDPYLLSRMAVAFVKVFQGNDPKYFKAIATVKHFVANNSEFNRHTGSSNVSERWLREYYLQAFEAAVKEGHVCSVMAAYNTVNGIPMCANKWLLTSVLRNEWGFKGYVVSDCGAVSDIVHGHHFETDPEKAVALAVKAGTDLECETCETEQFMYDKYLLKAVKKGYITEDVIDRAVFRLFRARFLLGEFDPPEVVPYIKIPLSKLDCREHRDLALLAAKESIVLLKNKNHFLPLNKNSIKRIALIGPNADRAILGGYSGSPAIRISPLMGLKDKLNGEVEILFAKGCSILGKKEVGWDEQKDRPKFRALDETKSINEAAKLAAKADVAIVAIGTDLSVANESADRKDLKLPGNQLELVKKVYQANPNTVVVLINGMPLAINWINEHLPAIIEAWYPGQAGGTTIADVLFGDYNPGGKLAVTFYKSVDQLPPIDDYDISKGRTYWFFDGKPLYRFGYGLSYTTFEFSNLQLPMKSEIGKEVKVSVMVKNTGKYAGDEVVQLYVKDMKASEIVAKRKLEGFKRVHLKPGEQKTINFVLKPKQFAFVKNQNQWTIEPGKFLISVGGRQPYDNESKPGCYKDVCISQITLIGKETVTQ